MIWRISKRAFSLSKKRHIWHNHLKNRAVSFCPMYHFAPVSPIFNIGEACIGVLGIQDICHFSSRNIGYFPFYFQGYGILCSISGILFFSSKIYKYRVEIPITSIKIISIFPLRRKSCRGDRGWLM